MLPYRKIALDLLHARDKGLCYVCGNSLSAQYAKIVYVGDADEVKNLHLIHKRCLGRINRKELN